jgi:hypothetical protein
MKKAKKWVKVKSLRQSWFLFFLEEVAVQGKVVCQARPVVRKQGRI